MREILIRRLATALPTLLAVLLLSFALMRLAPGSPFDADLRFLVLAHHPGCSRRPALLRHRSARSIRGSARRSMRLMASTGRSPNRPRATWAMS